LLAFTGRAEATAHHAVVLIASRRVASIASHRIASIASRRVALHLATASTYAGIRP
jgi:hypothetical protein